jgi:pyridoxine kinase
MAKKRIAAIHDISGFGRCSLTVALPVLSAAGFETSVIPTAVLSTHTGGFSGYTYRDLTDDILPIARHWQSLGLHFDAIYTGFLGSIEQTEIVAEAIELIRSADTLVIVDPAMADFGRLYSTFPDDFPAAMRTLCAGADVIVPNLTEAALLLGEPYSEGPFDRNDTDRMLRALGDMMSRDVQAAGGHSGGELTGRAAARAPRVVLTGVTYEDAPDVIGAASYDTASGETSYAGKPRIEPMYHGTGDVFASVLTAALTFGKTLPEASEIAVGFTVDSILRTKEAEADNRFGVDFEEGLAGLRALIN